MEPLLFLGGGGDLFGSIASQSVELMTELINSPPALREVAKLFTLAVHESFWDVVLTKSSAELIPRCGQSSGRHVQKVLPP